MLIKPEVKYVICTRNGVHLDNKEISYLPKVGDRVKLSKKDQEYIYQAIAEKAKEKANYGRNGINEYKGQIDSMVIDICFDNYVKYIEHDYENNKMIIQLWSYEK